MDVNEFVNRIFQFVFDKKAVDSYGEKWNLSFRELMEIRLNSIVIQWYATKVYISARTITDKLPGIENASTTQIYHNLFLTPGLLPEDMNGFKSEILLKITEQKDFYNSVYVSGLHDITGYPFIREIGECFAELCNRSDSEELKKLGSNLFGSCLNKCINEFKYVRIDFLDSRG
ncbi:MAG: hypothetical protein WCY58_06175 [Mariniphaga sp.]|nr:hypothetical protein [Mariniphaga sp.]MDD4226261.1 hypothetical protein [Mariniphaga sp.]MDD4425509.1 hypothetical protein [Mariniphaga sp.]